MFFCLFCLLDFLCLRSSRMQLWMNDCSCTQHVLNIHRSGYSPVWLLHGWCHMKMLPSRRKFSVHHTIMHQFIVPLYLKPHTYDACVFSCNLPPATCTFGRMDLLRATAVIRGWNGYRNKSQHRRFGHESVALPLSCPRFPVVVTPKDFISAGSGTRTKVRKACELNLNIFKNRGDKKIICYWERPQGGRGVCVCVCVEFGTLSFSFTPKASWCGNKEYFF